MKYPIIRVKKDAARMFAGLIIIWAIYVVLSLLAPAAQAVTRYGLTLAQAQLLRVTILLPLLFIWITAMFSVVRFRRYSLLVEGSSEEPAFKKITKGLWMLVAVIILPNFISLIATFQPNNFALQELCTIIRNYLTIIFYAAAFWYWWQASRELNGSIDKPNWGDRYHKVIIFVLTILTFVYAWAIFQNPFRTVSTDPLVLPTFYLPDWLIILTVIIPYAFIWMMGSLAILNIWSYAKKVPGVIYRNTFSFVAAGLTVTIGLLIFLQFLSQANYALSHSTLKIILVIIYPLLLLIAVGYLLIARGAQKLTAIEEVE